MQTTSVHHAYWHLVEHRVACQACSLVSVAVERILALHG